MLNQDLNLTKRINNYIDYIVNEGICIQKGQYVEIVSSSYNVEIIKLLKQKLINNGAIDVIITYNDGKIIEEEINENWELFLNNKINLYNSLISKLFARITLLSPFIMPITRTKYVDKYNQNINKLEFVNEYFRRNLTQHIVAAIPNEFWANKLQISLNELWNRIIDYTFKTSLLEKYRLELSEIEIESIYFSNLLGTDLEVYLIDEYCFRGKKHKTINNICYEPNIPCLEIYTTPNKYKVNGRLVSSKPLYYKNTLIKEYELFFENGRVIYEKNLNEILRLEDNLYYAGEIALVIPFDNYIYYNTLLDENLGCHLALGNSYDYDIKKDYVNKSKYHIDLVFGTDDINCSAKLKNGSTIEILKNGKFVYKEK